MTTKKMLMAATLGMGLFGLGQSAQASSHREAPAISQDPVADNTDLWAWVTPTSHAKLEVVMAYNPLEEPAGGPNFNEFSTEVLYELHITRGPSSLNDILTYQFTFKSDPIPRNNPADMGLAVGGGKEFFSQLVGNKMYMTVTKIDRTNKNSASVIANKVPVAPPNIGPRTDAAAYKNGGYTDAYITANFVQATQEAGGGRVFAGPRDDGFYVDLGGVFDLANLRPTGMAQDNVAGYNCHAIVIEIPTQRLTTNGQAPATGATDAQTIGVWASASRRQISYRLRDGYTYNFGPWVQVSRLGLPLINEAVIGYQDKDRWNAYRPTQESVFFPYFLNPVIVRDYELVSGTMLPNQRSNRTDIVNLINLKNIPAANSHNITATGDVLRVDIGTDSVFPNGRSLVGGAAANKEQADVTDILLSFLITGMTSGVADNVNSNDKPYLTDFPWLPLPWTGYNQGHGKLAP